MHIRKETTENAIIYSFGGCGLMARVSRTNNYAFVQFDRAQNMPTCLKTVLGELGKDTTAPLTIEIQEPYYQRQLEKCKKVFGLDGPFTIEKEGVETIVYRLLQMPQPHSPGSSE